MFYYISVSSSERIMDKSSNNICAFNARNAVKYLYLSRAASSI